MTYDISIRDFIAGDEYQILKLLNRNLGDQQHLNINRDLNWWKWKYEDNIFGKPIIKIGEHKGEIIACRIFWPWRLYKDGKELVCYQPVDAVVDEKYRGKGIFTKLTNAILTESAEKIDLIFNFPNEQSIQGNLNAGWSFLGKINWYVKINNFFPLLKMLKNQTGYTSLKLNKKDRITKAKIDLVKSSVTTSKITAIKNNEFLNWRYLHHPQIYYGMEIIKIKNSELSFIYEINENNIGRELIILDYFGDMKLFREMITRANEIAKEYNVVFTCFVEKNGISKRVLLRNLYFRQKKKNFTVLPTNKFVRDSALHYENWDLFLGMHDSV